MDPTGRLGGLDEDIRRRERVAGLHAIGLLTIRTITIDGFGQTALHAIIHLGGGWGWGKVHRRV